MRRATRNPGQEYQTAVDNMTKADAKLARTFNAWQKARLRLRIAEKALDKAMNTQNVT